MKATEKQNTTRLTYRVTKWYEHYGKGNPGWNAGIKVTALYPPGDGRRTISGRPTEVAYGSWPMVHGVACLNFRDKAAMYRAYEDLQEGEVSWEQLLPYLDDYAARKYAPNDASRIDGLVEA